MKRTKKGPNLTIYRANHPAYPNAADNRYFAHKALDIVTAIVSAMGLVSAMLFLVTLT